MSEAPVLTVLDLTADTQEVLLSKVAEELLTRDLVRPTFLDALSEREKRFPTGIDFGGFQIAIPHIDPEHVLVPGLAVCRNTRTVGFHAMDDPSKVLDVRLTIWPLVTNGENQVGLLSLMLTTLQQPGRYQTLLTAGERELAEVLGSVVVATSAA